MYGQLFLTFKRMYIESLLFYQFRNVLNSFLFKYIQLVLECCVACGCQAFNILDTLPTLHISIFPIS